MNETQKKIESLLFFKNQPVSKAWLAKTLSLTETVIQQELLGMTPHYEGRGIDLAFTEHEVSLVTSKDTEKLVGKLSDQEDAKELSKQALETLAIIIYKGKVTKPEIDFIRGVNSLYILRNLLIRGIIEKIPNKDDKRSVYYVPTLDILGYLGVSKVEDLDHYETFKESLAQVHTQFEAEIAKEAQE